MVTLFDDRENNSEVPKFLRTLIPEDQLIQKRLEIGDYWVHGLKKTICIERKTGKDFLDSIFDGRNNNQHYDRSTAFDYSITILELNLSDVNYQNDNSWFNLVNMQEKIIYSAMASLCVKQSPDGFQGTTSVIPTCSPYGTALFIKALHDLITTPFGDVRIPHFKKEKVSDDFRALAMVCSAPGIGEVKGNALLDHFGSPMSVFEATREQLMEVKGIGEKLSNQIKDILNIQRQVKRNE